MSNTKLTYTKTNRQGKSRSITRDQFKKKLNKAYERNAVSSSITEKGGVRYQNLSANLGRKKFTQSTPLLKEDEMSFRNNAIKRYINGKT